ncbi:MAG: hypothetical protein U0237_08875 [Thermoleophilia bacterium]
MRSRAARAVVAAVVAVLIALVASGCTSRLQMTVQMDRDGRGTVTLTLRMDRDALQTLGLSADDTDAIGARLEPMLADGNWFPAGSGDTVRNVFAVNTADDGSVSLSTAKRFDNVDQLRRIVDERRDVRALAGEGTGLDALFAGLPDLPGTAPLLNEFSFRLGDGTGDNPGFNLFARGGVGDIGQQTCQGDRATGYSKTLRDALEIEYRFRLPGGPGATNATESSGSDNVWRIRYEDCPALQAESGGGSSSTLVNGVILGALSAFLVMVFLVRGLRRRRNRRSVS